VRLSPAELASALALVGVVILIAALLSGLVERSGVPQVAIFLALGAALGPAGLGALDVGLGSPALHIVSTLSLALILFTDALTLDLREARQHRALSA
jgi:NhaP-type Na+/H+ or K+/H+ antiporter